MPDSSAPRMDDPARDAHITLPGEQQAHNAGEAEEHFLTRKLTWKATSCTPAGGYVRAADTHSARKMTCADRPRHLRARGLRPALSYSLVSDP
jgi:hypothetical protein